VEDSGGRGVRLREGAQQFSSAEVEHEDGAARMPHKEAGAARAQPERAHGARLRAGALVQTPAQRLSAVEHQHQPLRSPHAH